MSTQTLTPTAASATGWANPNNAISDTGTYADSVSLGQILTIYDATEIDDLGYAHIGHPQTSIEYITVGLYVSGTGTLNVRLLGANTSTSQKAIVQSGSAGWKYVTFYRTTTNERINPLDLFQDTTFGIEITTVSVSLGVNVHAPSIEVTYLQDNYVHGDMVTFPVAPDTIPRVENSVDRSTPDEDYVIKADQVNLLANAVVSLERVLTQDAAYLGALAGSSLHIGESTLNRAIYVLSATVTGSHANEIFGRLSWIENSVTIADVRLVDVYSGQHNFFNMPVDLDTLSPTAEKIEFSFVSAIGWTDESGTYTPFVVSAQIPFLYKDGTTVGYGLGFTTMPPDVSNAVTQSLSTTRYPDMRKYTTNSIPYYQNVPFEIRIFGIGVAV